MTDMAQRIGAARDYLSAHGWKQQDFGSSTSGVCLMGAVRNSMGCQGFVPTKEAKAVEDFLADVVIETLGETVKVRGDKWVEFELVYPNEYGGISTDTDSQFAVAYYNDRVLNDIQEALGFLDKARIQAEEKVA